MRNSLQLLVHTVKLGQQHLIRSQNICNQIGEKKLANTKKKMKTILQTNLTITKKHFDLYWTSEELVMTKYKLYLHFI